MLAPSSFTLPEFHGPEFHGRPGPAGPTTHVLMLGVGSVGSAVLASLGASRRVRIVGLVARGRGAHDVRGLGPSLVAELASRPRPSAAAPPAALDFPAGLRFVVALARLTRPALIDCTGATDVEDLYREARARGVLVVSARRWATFESPECAAARMMTEIAARPVWPVQSDARVKHIDTSLQDS